MVSGKPGTGPKLRWRWRFWAFSAPKHSLCIGIWHSHPRRWTVGDSRTLALRSSNMALPAIDILGSPPLVLVANDQEWSTRSLESVLGPRGFATVRAFTGKQ